MKKWLLILLVLVMTVCAAQAESMNEFLRERKLIVNGAEETIVESKYISLSGFALWVDADHFWPKTAYSGTYDEFADTASVLGGAERTVTVLMVPSEVNFAEAESYLGEAVALYPEETVSEQEYVQLPSGLEYYTRQAVEEGVVYRFYAVKNGESLLCITAGFPEAMAEEYTTRVNAMINTIEILETVGE